MKEAEWTKIDFNFMRRTLHCDEPAAPGDDMRPQEGNRGISVVNVHFIVIYLLRL
jgi:hypothetical protein